MLDISPKFRVLIFEDEVVVPGTFSDVPGQLVGGWLAESQQLSQGSVKIQAITERILFGSATEPLTGVGIFIGKDGSDYELRVGDPSGNYIHYDGSDVSVVGGIITGGTIQTAVSGSRVKLTSTGIQVFDSDQATEIALIQSTESGTLFSSTSPNVAGRMFQHINFVQSGFNTNPMVYLEAADVGAGTNILELQQRGDKESIKITHYSTSAGNAINILYSGSATEVVKIVNDTASVKCLYVSNIYVSSAAYVAEFINAGASAGVGAVYIEGMVAAIAPCQVKQNTATVANTNNYYKVFSFNGGGITKSIWISDGNSPDTDGLTGAIGDICMNCDDGKAYYNSDGGTTWVAM